MTVDYTSANDRPPDAQFKSNVKQPTRSNQVPELVKTSVSRQTYLKVPAHSQVVISACIMELNNNKQQRSLQPIAPLSIVADHTLVTDWPLSSTSPGSTFMYESDPLEQNLALLSPSTSDNIQSPLAQSVSSTISAKPGYEQPIPAEEESINLARCDMSMWGQIEGGPIHVLEYLNDFESGGMSIRDIGDELAALTSSSEKPEQASGDDGSLNNCGAFTGQDPAMDSVQTGLKDDKVSGPTLAQLNDRESVLDRFVSVRGYSTQPRGSWSGDANNATVIVTTSSSTDSSHTNSSGATSSTAQCWEDSYSFVSAPAASDVAPKSGPSSSATLASIQVPTVLVGSSHGSCDNKSQQSNKPCAVSAGVLNQSGFVQTDPVVKTAIGIRNNHDVSAPSLFTNAKQNSGFADVSLQQLLSAKKASMNVPVSIRQATEASPGVATTTVPQAESMKGKKRGAQSPEASSNGSTGSMERKWEEIRSYLDSNTKCEEEGITLSSLTTLPTGSPLKKIKTERISPGYQDVGPAFFRQDEVDSIKQEHDSDYDNSDDELSDVESNASYGSFAEEILHGDKKEKKHFWQYNTQSKGPKGKRLCKSMQEQDPHYLADFEDPVFQPDINDARYKHNGKARKGDGNDITPSPWKLFQIGNELQKLTKKINILGEMEKPTKSRDGVKSKSRKEKNKFASRACRLKKKAQHEANKVKLFGLENEHHQLMDVLKNVKRNIHFHVKDRVITPSKVQFTAMLEKEIKEKLTTMIAGNTADFVNTVLQRVAEGDKHGGILDRG